MADEVPTPAPTPKERAHAIFAKILGPKEERPHPSSGSPMITPSDEARLKKEHPNFKTLSLHFSKGMNAAMADPQRATREWHIFYDETPTGPELLYIDVEVGNYEGGRAWAYWQEDQTTFRTDETTKQKVEVTITPEEALENVMARIEKERNSPPEHDMLQ